MFALHSILLLSYRCMTAAQDSTSVRCRKPITSILLAVICLAAAPNGVESEKLQELLYSVPADTGCTAAVTNVVAMETRIECAAIAMRSDNWRSFSFIKGVCVVSDNAKCAAADAVTIFRKLGDLTASGPSASILGYEKAVDSRRFWVFQQRQAGTVSFARNWTDYETGFGDSNDFWIGLQTLSSLTASGSRTLRMEAVTVNFTYYVSEWSNFTVGNASSSYFMQYNLYLTGNSNVSGDCMSYSKGNKFSTFDRDNDQSASDSLSVIFANSGFLYGSSVAFTPNALFSSTDKMGNAIYISCFYIYSSVWPNTYATIRSIRLMVQI